jgi:hypothetical protein
MHTLRSFSRAFAFWCLVGVVLLTPYLVAVHGVGDAARVLAILLDGFVRLAPLAALGAGMAAALRPVAAGSVRAMAAAVAGGWLVAVLVFTTAAVLLPAANHAISRPRDADGERMGDRPRRSGAQPGIAPGLDRAGGGTAAAPRLPRVLPDGGL